MQVKWHQPVFDLMDVFVAVFHLHNIHAKKSTENHVKVSTTVWQNVALAVVASLLET